MTDTGPNHFSSSLEKYSIPQRRDPGTSKGILPQSIRVMNLQTDNTNQTPLASGSGPSSISSDTMTGRLEKLSLNAEDAELPQLAFPNINISASASLLQARTDPFSVHNLAVGLQQAPYEAVNGYLESYEHEHIVTALNTEQVYEWPPIFFAAVRQVPSFLFLSTGADFMARLATIPDSYEWY